MLHARLVRRRAFPIDATLDCAAGELLAIAGPSGSGKTTLLRMIAGLERIDAGTVRCGDAVWADARTHRPPEARGAGLVFQHYALFPHLDALGNVGVALGHLPRAARRERAAELLSLVNLDGLGERRPRALSGGQRQRVALARALARGEAPGPGVLLLDEPFAAVDQLTRERLHTELARLRARLDRPVLLVTHDMHEVMRLADRVSVVHRGRTLDTGTVERVMARPSSAHVARLLGHKNLLRVTCTRIEAERVVLRAGAGEVSVALDAGATDAASPGRSLTLLVPAAAIVLHRVDRPSRGERENPLGGTVAELLRLGHELELAVALDPDPNSDADADGDGDGDGDGDVAGVGVGAASANVLRFRVSRHVGARNALVEGSRVGLSLLAAELHVLPESRTDP